MRILYVNVIEQHAGWGAEYFIDRALRQLGHSTFNLDYRSHRWSLSRRFLGLPDFDALLLQRADRFPLPLVRACRRPRFFWATELVARRPDQRHLLRSGLFEHVFVRSLACRETVVRQAWLQPDRVSVLLSGFDQHLYRRLPGVARDIDVLFVGSLTRRRRQILRRLARRHRVAVRKAVGEELVLLLNRARIVLNIHAEDHIDTETRVYEVLGSGAFLLTERLSQESPFRSGEHLVEVDSVEAMEAAIGHYLQTEEERESIARSGEREALEKHTNEQRARQIADEMSRVVETGTPAGPAIDRSAVRAFARWEAAWNVLRLARTLPEIGQRAVGRALSWRSLTWLRRS